MASKGNSIAAVAAKALDIDKKMLPEKLRSRLNYYVKDKALKSLFIDEEQVYSEANKYTSRPVRSGNLNFVRNLIFLDILFEDKKKIVDWLVNGNALSKKDLKEYYLEWKHKKQLYQKLDSQISVLDTFFSKKDIDWRNEKVPYPFSGNEFNSTELIIESISADSNPSSYDQAIKALINNEYAQLKLVLDQASESFINGEGKWLRLLYDAKLKEFEDYHSLLKKY